MGSPKMNLARIDSLGQEWAPLIETIAALITLAPEFVVVQTYPRNSDEIGPYVQTLQEEDGFLTIEAASDTYLPGVIGPDALNTLHEFGWEDPSDTGLPNYNILLKGEDVRPGDVAAFLVLTLRDVYLVTTNHQFECAPLDLFVQVVHGEFGITPGLRFSPFDFSMRRDVEET